MSRALRVELEALEELREAAVWYESKRPGLGVELIEAVERTAERVREMPAAFPMVLEHPRVRRAHVRRFPYVIVFSVREDVIHVLAYAHGKRRPLYWLGRVVQEDE